jgi:hypothetical protein
MIKEITKSLLKEQNDPFSISCNWLQFINNWTKYSMFWTSSCPDIPKIFEMFALLSSKSYLINFRLQSPHWNVIAFIL